MGFLSPGDLPNPGTEPRSPALQADALPSEPPGKPVTMDSLKDKSKQKFINMSAPGLPGGTVVKNPICQCRRSKRCRFDPWLGKIPWRKKWQPAPVFLPGKCHGPRSLGGYSPWGHKELDTNERLNSCSSSYASYTERNPGKSDSEVV